MVAGPSAFQSVENGERRNLLESVAIHQGVAERPATTHKGAPVSQADQHPRHAQPLREPTPRQRRQQVKQIRPLPPVPTFCLPPRRVLCNYIVVRVLVHVRGLPAPDHLRLASSLELNRLKL